MPDNQSAVPVSQRARELLAESCDRHGFSAHTRLIRKLEAALNAATDQEAE